jgi:hypothetical protein
MSTGGKKKIQMLLHSKARNDSLHSSTFGAFRHKDVKSDVKYDNTFYNFIGTCTI